MELAGQGSRRWKAAQAGRAREGSDSGYAMAALLVGLSVMAVLMSMALPVWSHMARREKEEELIWRGQQYARAVGLFQRKFANTFPPSIDLLVEQKFLRKKYKDPITDDDFQPIPAGVGLSSVPGMPPGAGPGQTPGPGAGGQMPGGRGQMPGGGIGQMPSGFGQTPSPGPGGGAGAGGGGFGSTQLGRGGPGMNAPNIGIAGVVSKSKDTSIKIYNGRQKYNEWAFVYIQTAQQIAPGVQVPGRGPAPGMNVPGRGFQPFDPSGRGGRPPVPFGQQPQGSQPSPFGQSPFGQSPFGPQRPQRPPGQ